MYVPVLVFYQSTAVKKLIKWSREQTLTMSFAAKPDKKYKFIYLVTHSVLDSTKTLMSPWIEKNSDVSIQEIARLCIREYYDLLHFMLQQVS
jgi:hypothetical protein